MRVSAVVIILALAFGASVRAAGAADTLSDSCASLDDDPNQRISACTSLLQSENDPQRRSVLLSNRGAAYDDKHDYEAAMSDLDEAIDLDENNVNAYINRGVVFSHEKQYSRAMREIQKAITLDQSSWKAYFDLGLLYDVQGAGDWCIQYYEKAIALAPDEEEPYYALARYYRQKKDYSHAITTYSALLKRDGLNPEAHYERGNAYFDVAQWSRAIDDFREATDVRKYWAKGENALCYTEAIAGELDAAVDDCDRAVRDAPGDADALDSRAFAYLKMRNYRAAMKDYNAALRRQPRMAEALYGRGLAKRALHIPGYAADLQAALHLQPDVARELAGYGAH